ncbi:MAG TPA: phosphatase PAP2 family protein [Candidatus Paceibacterota bacterium]|nr:phosphatase PAP2 family protein [Candidatus Paceibacterota bacterium]
MNFNQSVFDLIYGFAHRSVFLDAAGVFFANDLPYLLVLGFLIFAFRQKGSRMKFLVFAEGALAVILARGIVDEVIRFFYHHLRPEGALGITPLIAENGYSFPSGHASFFFALSMVIFFYSRRLGAWYFVLSATNGFARIFVGVHWPLDILGGIVTGIVCGIIVRMLTKPTFTKMRKEAPDILPQQPA